MHPIERLRDVARASGADRALPARETAHALSAFHGAPAHLVAAATVARPGTSIGR